jgi:lysophospholipase L1-like esterase
MRTLRLLAATVLTVGLGVATPGHAAAVADPIRIMPLGDSITWGEGSSTTSSYRADLWRHLVDDAGVAVDFVGSQQSGSLPDRDNEGHSGWRIEQITASVDGWLTTYRPDVVLIHLGTNDLAQEFDVAGAPDRMAALIDRITAHSPATTVLVSAIVPSTYQIITDRVDAFNARLPGIVQTRAQQGKKVRHVDLDGAVGTADLADFLHPNDAGYAKMAGVWHAALEPVLAAGRDWPLFTSGLESGERPATWLNTTQASVDVGGFCCGLTGMETAPRAETAYGGTSALMYSGNDTSAVRSYAYNRVFDVHLPVSRDTVLTYWVHPLQRNGTFVAVDVALTDGGNLRDSGAVDQSGVRAHPQLQGEGGRLIVNRWNLVRVHLGALAGRTVDRIHLGYDQPAGTGLFRGYVDDIRFVNLADSVAAPEGFARVTPVRRR